MDRTSQRIAGRALWVVPVAAIFLAIGAGAVQAAGSMAWQASVPSSMDMADSPAQDTNGDSSPKDEPATDEPSDEESKNSDGGSKKDESKNKNDGNHSSDSSPDGGSGGGVPVVTTSPTPEPTPTVMVSPAPASESTGFGSSALGWVLLSGGLASAGGAYAVYRRNGRVV